MSASIRHTPRLSGVHQAKGVGGWNPVNCLLDARNNGAILGDGRQSSLGVVERKKRAREKACQCLWGNRRPGMFRWGICRRGVGYRWQRLGGRLFRKSRRPRGSLTRIPNSTFFAAYPKNPGIPNSHKGFPLRSHCPSAIVATSLIHCADLSLSGSSIHRSGGSA